MQERFRQAIHWKHPTGAIQHDSVFSFKYLCIYLHICILNVVLLLPPPAPQKPPSTLVPYKFPNSFKIYAIYLAPPQPEGVHIIIRKWNIENFHLLKMPALKNVLVPLHIGKRKIYRRYLYLHICIWMGRKIK